MEEGRKPMLRVLARKLRSFKWVVRNKGLSHALRMLKGQVHLALLRRFRRGDLMPRRLRRSGVTMYLALSDEGLSTTLFCHGVHEAVQVRWLRKELTPGMVAVDIGANLGYYVLLEAARIGRDAEIYAVEPNPVAFGILEKNIRLNRLTNVTTDRLAMGAEAGEAEFHVTRQFNTSHIATPSLDSDWRRRRNGIVSDTIRVEMTTLDRFVRRRSIRRLDFLRMDVEGYELEIVKGGRETLSNMRPMAIFVELHPFLAANVTPFLELVTDLWSMGFRVKYLARETSETSLWPSLEFVTNYLSRETFPPPPHLWLVKE